MDLKPTQMEFEVSDESGYRFHVVANYDSEFRGWSATVAFSTNQRATPEKAVERLAEIAKEFIRIVEEK